MDMVLFVIDMKQPLTERFGLVWKSQKMTHHLETSGLPGVRRLNWEPNRWKNKKKKELNYQKKYGEEELIEAM